MSLYMLLLDTLNVANCYNVQATHVDVLFS
jgi:hypothetical protein